MNDQPGNSAEDEWQARSTNAVYEFGLALKGLHETNPWPNAPLLPSAMNHLMTELWDQGFSQSQIREAFEDAVANMPRYAAGDEVRR
jgi:hypothetical protein